MSIFSNLYNSITADPSTSTPIGGNVPLNVGAGVPAQGGAGIMQSPQSGAGASFSSQYLPKIGVTGSLPNMPGPNSMQAPAMPQMQAPPQASNLGFKPTPTAPTPMANPQAMGPPVPTPPPVPIQQAPPPMIPGQNMMMNPQLQRRGLLQQ